MRGHCGFKWPMAGAVAANDWSASPKNHRGLFGLLWGEGDYGECCLSPDAIWLVVEVDAAEVVDMGGKVKFPRGVVVYCGNREDATKLINERKP